MISSNQGKKENQEARPATRKGLKVVTMIEEREVEMPKLR